MFQVVITNPSVRGAAVATVAQGNKIAQQNAPLINARATLMSRI
jgi:hypothetical protein